MRLLYLVIIAYVYMLVLLQRQVDHQVEYGVHSPDRLCVNFPIQQGFQGILGQVLQLFLDIQHQVVLVYLEGDGDFGDVLQ